MRETMGFVPQAEQQKNFPEFKINAGRTEYLDPAEAKQIFTELEQKLERPN